MELITIDCQCTAGTDFTVRLMLYYLAPYAQSISSNKRIYISKLSNFSISYEWDRTIKQVKQDIKERTIHE